MPQLKHAALLQGDTLQDLATGQLYKLHPTEEEMKGGIWEYNCEADGSRWQYVIMEGIPYAINELFVDWDDDGVKVWSPNEMGQWPFGNRPTEDEVFFGMVDDILFDLDCYLESELDWMNKMDEEMEPESDDDTDEDPISDDEGYNTSPEVDFGAQDYWALGLNNHLWRISLYKEGEDGYWTL